MYLSFEQEGTDDGLFAWYARLIQAAQWPIRGCGSSSITCTRSPRAAVGGSRRGSRRRFPRRDRRREGQCRRVGCTLALCALPPSAIVIGHEPHLPQLMRAGGGLSSAASPTSLPALVRFAHWWRPPETDPGVARLRAAIEILFEAGRSARVQGDDRAAAARSAWCHVRRGTGRHAGRARPACSRTPASASRAAVTRRAGRLQRRAKSVALPVRPFATSSRFCRERRRRVVHAARASVVRDFVPTRRNDSASLAVLATGPRGDAWDGDRARAGTRLTARRGCPLIRVPPANRFRIGNDPSPSPRASSPYLPSSGALRTPSRRSAPRARRRPARGDPTGRGHLVESTSAGGWGELRCRPTTSHLPRRSFSLDGPATSRSGTCGADERGRQQRRGQGPLYQTHRHVPRHSLE